MLKNHDQLSWKKDINFSFFLQKIYIYSQQSSKLDKDDAMHYTIIYIFVSHDIENEYIFTSYLIPIPQQ